MKVTLAKLRLVLHFLHGVWIVATRYARLSEQRKRALNRAWSLKLLRLVGMRLVVHHDDRRIDQGVLVVANHVSWLDIYLINAWRPTPFVSKAEVRQWPVVGWLAHRLDTIFIHREKRRDAQRAMHEMAVRLEGGGRVCVFPEGTTSNGLALLPFHANLFQAAVSAQCPVQPVCLLYEDRHGRQSTTPAYIDDVSLGQSLDAVLRSGPFTAHLYVGEAIAAMDDRRALSAKARDAVALGLSELQATVGRALEQAISPSEADASGPELERHDTSIDSALTPRQ
jgi:1-acyl-sn-glycerol-3-phosphate acyltransferase